MFAKNEVFNYDKFTLTSLGGKVYEYVINGYAKTINNKEIGLEFNRDDIEVFESITQEFKSFKDNQTPFMSANFYLNGKEVLEMEFKYVGSGIAEMYDLLVGQWYLTAEQLGIELLND
ncbi:hypothetical protein [Solibacillus sp. CAU 1738]|uniref:hypothetical protein n=1 Tax=Solibacillus sp. CAU 1738 TaxID=3140363 RepID=UPI003260C065